MNDKSGKVVYYHSMHGYIVLLYMYIFVSGWYIRLIIISKILIHTEHNNVCYY